MLGYTYIIHKNLILTVVKKLILTVVCHVRNYINYINNLYHFVYNTQLSYMANV